MLAFLLPFFVELKRFSPILPCYNFLSYTNSEAYCHSDIIKAFPASAVCYSNPIRSWRNAHVESLNHKRFSWGQLFQRRSGYRVEGDISHLCSHSGNTTSWTGLLLTCAHDKYMVLEMDLWSFRCLPRTSCPTRTGSRQALCVLGGVNTAVVCLAGFDYLQPHWWRVWRMANNWLNDRS